jgi:hypothetical protein
LRDFVATGNAGDYDLRVEYEQAARRRRTLTWSQGTRERYGVEVTEDPEILNESMGSEDTIAIPNESWRVVRDQAEVLLGVAEPLRPVRGCCVAHRASLGLVVGQTPEP